MEDELALLIPLAPFLLGGLWMWTKHQTKMAEMQVKATAEKAAQYAQHTAQLEERVRVLERIVTDKGTDLARQIEALREEESDALKHANPLFQLGGMLRILRGLFRGGVHLQLGHLGLVLGPHDQADHDKGRKRYQKGKFVGHGSNLSFVAKPQRSFSISSESWRLPLT